jgi:hypothetical protein
VNIARRFTISCCALVVLALGLPLSPASADPGPAWNLAVTPMPSNFAPGNQNQFFVLATNVGGKSTEGQSEIKVSLPSTLSPTLVEAINTSPKAPTPECSIDIPSNSATCKTSAPILPGQLISTQVFVDVVGSGSSLTQIEVSGGATPASLAATSSPPLQEAALPFDFEAPGLRAPFSEEGGAAATIAGSHPYQQTIAFGFPTEDPGFGITNAGHPRDVIIDLPPGLIGNPSATPVLCTEVQLQTNKCPEASQAGLLNLTTSAGAGRVALTNSPIYEMVPPPGNPAELAFDIQGLGLFAHIFASVRSDGDYGISVISPDILALGLAPIFDVQTQIWGDPTSENLDFTRGVCIEGIRETDPDEQEEKEGKTPEQIPCSIERSETAFWSLPIHCDSQPFTTSALADSWEEPGIFQSTSYQSATLGGSPVSLTGCDKIQFQPTISVTPTTNLSDSPSGLEVTLHQPQNTNLDQPATAQLRDARVTLPPGLVVNPSQADGRGACSPAQIGLTTPVGQSPVHFTKDPQTCPDAAKLGSADVTTPLIAQRKEGETTLITDPQTKKPLLRPLEGAVYLAEPYENPFNSLIAIYLVDEDPKTGTVAKVAGKVETDPKTGQITTIFEDNPQLPLEDIKLHLFKGSRASLTTPPNCGTHTTNTVLTPWSKNASEGSDATPKSDFQTTASPNGTCPATADALPNAVSFEAGTLGRKAGAFSPFVLKLSRENGTQRLTKIDTLLPPGLAARFAGVAQCNEAQIAAAVAREVPNQGILERNSPSCPASSHLGTATVGAGSGAPYYAQGQVYLAGPYKGAPYSLAIITPAIAGPFDLGTVVSRAALHVDPETAQGHAVSDPLPTIIDGIPLDIRSVAIQLDRPDFTLNPTSCDPMAITGTVTSALGALVSLEDPFQVGECSSLPFKPKLSLELKGKTKRTSHPRLIANLTAKPGEANIARTQVKLPKAAFLDNAHIGTVCTRVQFAAKACPPGSVYGKVSATTPLLDYPLSGSVYLRSSSHQLPDLVADLNGPASTPIEIAVVGRTDSVKGALRNTFEAVPDAPVSRFHLELFGGKRGLIILSSGLCKNSKAQVQMDGQNGKVWDTSPTVKTSCKKSKKNSGKGKKKGGHHRHRAERR